MKNALDHTQAQGRQSEGYLTHYLPQSREYVVERTNATASPPEAVASAGFAPMAKPLPAELAHFTLAWNVRTSDSVSPSRRSLTFRTQGRFLRRFQSKLSS